MKYILKIVNDDAPESPCDWCGAWSLISFDRRSSNYESPDNYARMSAAGEVVPANIGLRAKFAAGLAFFLDHYEHGERFYSLHGEGQRCRWDTSNYSGVLVWNHKPGDMGAKTFEARADDARKFLETYNAWANGWVYGFILETLDGEHVDSCFGFYDAESMAEHLGENLKPGDKVKAAGDFPEFIESKHFPAGVELVSEFDEDEETEEAEAWAARM